MKLKMKFISNGNPKTYFILTLIDIAYINTYQVTSLNITILNVLVQFLHEKAPIIKKGD